MSLKWKTALFLVVLLLTVVTGFVLREQDVLNSQYRALRDSELERQVALSREALRQRLTQLQTVAGMVAMRGDVREVLGGNGKARLSKDFADQISALQINMGLSALHILSHQGLPVGDQATFAENAFAPAPLGDFLDKHRAAIYSEHPQSHALCRGECLLYAWAPVLHGGSAVGTVLVAAPISDAILAFYRVTQADFGILLDARQVPAGRPTLPSGEPIAALTGGEAAREVVMHLAPRWQDGSGFRWQEVRHDEHRFEVARWPVDLDGVRLPAEFIAVSKVDEAHAAIGEAFRGTLLGAAGVLVAAFALSWLLTRRFLRKLLRTAEAIHLLGERTYDAVREKLVPTTRTQRFRDELDTVNRITLEVANILENLEIEVQRNQDKLLAMVEELEREHQFVADLLDTAPVLIVAHDGEGRITLVNRFAAELTGIAAEQRIGQAYAGALFPAGQAAESLALIGEVRDDGIPRREESTLLAAGGERRDIVWVHCRLDQRGGQPLLLSVGQDVTLLKQLQAESEQRLRQLQQSQKMQAIGQLTGGIAHDFNNILASIMGYTGLAMERFAQDREGKLARYLGEVYRASERARDLVAQMLAFSRGSGSERHAVPLEPLVKEVVKMLRPLFPASLTIATHTETVPPVMGNVVQLQQIIMNLAINARDAMPERGKIAIAVARQHTTHAKCAGCQAEVMGDFVEISVSDDGCGIEAENLPRIFDPFFTTKTVGKGTGLGLSVVHGLVHDFGGHIAVESAPGQGSTFRVLLPVPVESATQPTDSGNLTLPDATDYLAASHTLIVDDDRSIAYYLGELLEMRKMRVTVETDAHQALTRFSASPDSFDLLISDLSMPSLGGLELVRKIRARRPDLPVILCSGKWDAALEQEAAALGKVSLLGKPIDTAILFDMIGSFGKLHQGNLREPQ